MFFLSPNILKYYNNNNNNNTLFQTIIHMDNKNK